MKANYHFLTGRVAVTKTFEADTKKAADEAAIDFGKSKKGVIRIQCDATGKHIWESEPEQKKIVDPEALLDQKADADADGPPTPASAARSTVVGLASKAAAIFIAMACLMLSLTSHAATIIGVLGQPGIAGYAVNSQQGGTQYTTAATNGLYGQSIQSAVAATAVVVTETNLVLINPGGQIDKDLVIQFTAAATAATGATNTIVWNLSASVLPVTITNNIYGQNSGATSRGTLGSYTLALNGTTTVTTNIVLGPNVAPYIANGENIYLESIGVVAGATATNYSVAVVQ